MRAFGIGLALAFAVAGLARADDQFDSDKAWVGPRDEVLRKQWPKGPDGHLLYGEVILDCAAGRDSRPNDCHVKASKPDDPDFAKRVLPLTSLYKARTTGFARATLALSILSDTSPDWLKKPSTDQMMAVYPGEAAKRGVAGTATIECVVQTNGLTRDCQILNEDRPGLGFGPAAVVLSRTFLFRPALKNGQPVETSVTVPINFAMGNDGSPGSGLQRDVSGRGEYQPRLPAGKNPTRVLGAAIWSKTPTVPDILAEIDKKVGDKFADGLVVLQCLLDGKSDKLSDCVVANASPGMAQFESVARALVPKFQADPATFAGTKGDALINIAFAFPDMASPEWDKRYLTHPQWVRTLPPDFGSTFPNAAAKAGLKTGKATVDCVVGADGSLSKCKAVDESTPNVGFGQMAARIAQTFAINAWSQDGLPVEGGHVLMPIQMNYDPANDAPQKDTAAAPTPSTKP
jgi:TonB family protein